MVGKQGATEIAAVCVLVLLYCHQGWCSVLDKAPAGSSGASSNFGVVAPDKFPYPARLGYEAAAKYPHVLSNLFCYCGCDNVDGHFSLLDCFKSDHSVDCSVCQQEAILARQLSDRHGTLRQIQEKVEKAFARGYPFKQPSQSLADYRKKLRSQGIISGGEANKHLGRDNLNNGSAGHCCAAGVTEK